MKTYDLVIIGGGINGTAIARDAAGRGLSILNAAPHIIWPMRFVLPYDKGLRPAWMLRLGLFMYDNMGGRKKLPGTKKVNLRKTLHSNILDDRFKIGFEYSDCWVEDARLVVLNAMDARERARL